MRLSELTTLRLGGPAAAIVEARGEDELVEAVRGVHILGIRSKTKVTEKVLAAADIRMVEGLGGEEVAAALARTRAAVARELPAIARLYMTPVP